MKEEIQKLKIENFNLRKELGESRTRNRLLNQAYIDIQIKCEDIGARLIKEIDENLELSISIRELTSKINRLKLHWLWKRFI